MSVLELGRRYVELFDSVNCSLTGLQAELRERHGVVIAAATGSAGAEEPIGRLWQSAREGDTLARVCARAGDST